MISRAGLRNYKSKNKSPGPGEYNFNNSTLRKVGGVISAANTPQELHKIPGPG